MKTVRIDPAKYVDSEMCRMGISRTTIRQARHQGRNIDLDEAYVMPLRHHDETDDAIVGQVYRELFYRRGQHRSMDAWREDLCQEALEALWRQSWRPQSIDMRYRKATAKNAMKRFLRDFDPMPDGKIGNPRDDDAIDFFDTEELLRQVEATVGSEQFQRALGGDTQAQKKIRETIWTSS